MTATATDPVPPSRRFFALLFAAGALVFLPSLRSPYILDDYLHAAMVKGRFGAPRGPLDLYDFVDPADRARMFDRGLLPWWTDPHLTIRFFRPLASALRFAELRLLDGVRGATLLQHLVSFLWWALAVVVAQRLFSRLLPARRPMLLATAIFALGPWHVLPLAWLANREALLSLVFGTLALLSHLRFREEGRARHGLVAAALFCVALGCGEYALAFGGYVLALELTGLARRDRPLARLVGVLPFALPAAAYLAIHFRFGYGTLGSGFYADPVGEPRQFLAAFAPRLATLLAEGWLTLGTDAWGTGAPKWIVVAIVVAALPFVTVAVRHTLARLDEQPRRNARFLLLGSLLALVPMLPAVPAPRLLGVAALGFVPVIALLVDGAWFPTADPIASAAPRRALADLTELSATVLAFLQIVHGPCAALLAGESLRRSSNLFDTSSAALAARLPTAAAVDNIVNSASGAIAEPPEAVIIRGTGGVFFGPLAIATATPSGALPRRWHILAHTGHLLALRTGEQTLELRTPPGVGLYPIGASNLFRSAAARLEKGDHVRVPGLTVDILDAGPQGPTRARFTFDAPFDDAHLRFFNEDRAGFEDARPPAVGFGAPFDP